MQSAALLRAQLEVSLAERAPSAFTLKVRQAPELLPTGTPGLDVLLGGGIPRGGITEITGTSTTGRTSLALSILARATGQGAVCAWVDVQDALDPETASAYGVQLERLLWLRAGRRSIGMQQPPPASPAGSHNEKTRSHPYNAHEATQHTGGGHPRHEHRSMGHAVTQLFHSPGGTLQAKRSGSTERLIELAAIGPRCAEPQPHRRKLEQISADRLPPRRGQTVLDGRANHRIEELIPEQRQFFSSGRPDGKAAQRGNPKSPLGQALSATDLLLQTGGFRAIVLDMGDVRADHVMRTPTSYWYRFRLLAEQTQLALILLTSNPCAKSCASLVLRCYRNDENSPWRGDREKALFTTLRYAVAVERRRNEEIGPLHKKPVARTTTEWQARAPWAR
ncbi:recombination protein RecA [Silvibacterium bohemicum]|uniref:Protein RecA n=1 Tax=Silvibacterium bohemicum TaxID=1577686 RepID=A0A841JV44_9BACT|nr:ATPase domain-containing protein [Silvibacterium bohemicum]MBB6144405.1 recombination protein RecA [Silvibacterium bohemicum]